MLGLPKSYNAHTSRVEVAPTTMMRHHETNPNWAIKPGIALNCLDGYIATWSRGLSLGYLWPMWWKPWNMLHSAWWLLKGNCMWIFTMLVCRVGRCSLSGEFCSSLGGTLGGFQMLIWCLIAWTNPALIGRSISRCPCRCFGIAPPQITWTSRFLIGLSGVGKSLKSLFRVL